MKKIRRNIFIVVFCFLSFTLFQNNRICSTSLLFSQDIARRIQTLGPRLDLVKPFPSESTGEFVSLLDWINFYERFDGEKSQPLTIAFTRNGEVMHEAEFKIPQFDKLSSVEKSIVADYVSRLVLFGQAFIGGDGVIADWPSELKDLVEGRFKEEKTIQVDGTEYTAGLKAMLNYLEEVYGKPYEFKTASREIISGLRKSELGFLMEVDKAVINLDPKAKEFSVPNAGPFGLAGVIEQYTPNQRGIYNMFKKLADTDEVFKKELEVLELMPALKLVEEGQTMKQVMRNLLIHTEDLLMGNVAISNELKKIEKDLKDPDTTDEEKSALVERKRKLKRLAQFSDESRTKVAKIYQEMGKALGITILIARRFIDIDNVMITGKATEGISGEIIKRSADRITEGINIWLPSDDPLEAKGKESELLKFNIGKDENDKKKKLSEYGQAIAMAAKISEQIYGSGNITTGKVVGIDCGSTDVKIVYSDNGDVLFSKSYRWDSGKIQGGTEMHKKILQVLVNLARLKVSLEQGAFEDNSDLQVLKNEVLALEESDGKEYATEEERYFAIIDVLDRAEDLGVKLADFEGFAISWAGAVLENNIVGRASIVNGIKTESAFKREINPLGVELARSFEKELGRIPFLVINDGEATAIMATMMGLPNVMGFAFGTSTGGGY